MQYGLFQALASAGSHDPLKAGKRHGVIPAFYHNWNMLYRPEVRTSSIRKGL
jgi:hypothetical protein